MDPICLKELLRADLGKPCRNLTDEEKNTIIIGLSTDSRNIKNGEIFLALKGENFDGHDYIEQAVAKGAEALIISDEALAEVWQSKLPVFCVQDTLKALQQWAKYYRRHYLQKVVAITGSVAKTSTRSMIVAGLKANLAVFSTPENMNNEIGVPQTIIAMPGVADVGVVETGMDHKGDLTVLSDVVQPDIAIITNIGYSHIEHFGSQLEIMHGKAEIITGLKENGILLLNACDEYLRKLAWEKPYADKKYRTMFVAAKDEAEIRQKLTGPCLYAKDIAVNDEGCYSFSAAWHDPANAGEDVTDEVLPLARIDLPVPGEHHITNALFALLTAKVLNQPLNIIAGGLANFSIVGNRQRMMDAKGVLLINDSYNAAPESMRVAVDTLNLLAKNKNKRRVAVLGGIAELGNMSATIHYDLGVYIGEVGVDELWVCGPEAENVRAGVEDKNKEISVHTFAERDQLIIELLPTIKDNDIILIKGSHSFAMEKVCDKIISKRLEDFE